MALLLVAPALLAGCTTEENPTASTPTGAASDACLAAAAAQNDYPVEDATAVEVTAERDDQGWWAVRATAPDGDRQVLLTCTAVPDDDSARGARAASWSVSSEPED